jgi:hypothetical protein
MSTNNEPLNVTPSADADSSIPENLESSEPENTSLGKAESIAAMAGSGPSDPNNGGHRSS